MAIICFGKSCDAKLEYLAFKICARIMRARILEPSAHMQKSCFTLLEIVAVIVIMMIGAGVAAVYLRSGSTTVAFEQAAREFKAFTVRARVQAMELGRDRVIFFYPSERVFRAGEPEIIERDETTAILIDPPADLVFESDSSDWQDPENFAKLSWKLPDGYELNPDSELAMNTFVGYDDALEVFRFFPDGGGSGTRNFVMSFQGLKKVFSVSALTGLIIEKENEE